MSFTTCLLVALGGAVGTFARFVISNLGLSMSHAIPWSTIIVNVTGSAMIGFVGTLTLSNGRYPVSEDFRLFLMVGFCGGYTTFSAFSLQTFDLLRTGAISRAILNVGASVILCVCAVWIGHIVASKINGHAAEIAQIAIEEEA